MAAQTGGCCGGEATQKATCAEPVETPAKEQPAAGTIYKLVDHKVTLLIAAGAAMAANCEACINKIVPELREAGVAEADIRRAVEIGQFVKDKPAGRMKNLADKLTGTRLAKGPVLEECPADKMKREATCS